MADRHQDLRASLRELAEQLDPTLRRPDITFGTERWPWELAERGIYSYVDEQGVVHFTLRIDRPKGLRVEEGSSDEPL